MIVINVADDVFQTFDSRGRGRLSAKGLSDALCRLLVLSELGNHAFGAGEQGKVVMVVERSESLTDAAVSQLEEVIAGSNIGVGVIAGNRHAIGSGLLEQVVEPSEGAGGSI